MMVRKTEHYALPRASFQNDPKVLIVIAPYYKPIADNLLKGATTEYCHQMGRLKLWRCQEH